MLPICSWTTQSRKRKDEGGKVFGTKTRRYNRARVVAPAIGSTKERFGNLETSWLKPDPVQLYYSLSLKVPNT